ncbi:MAG TPA: hypothetical protein VGP16_26325, partial [Asanoa sp.]|nr:hypothetical protein [Asanoa sp.]
MTSLSAQMARLALQAFVRLGARKLDATRRAALLQSARAPMAASTADDLAAELSPEESTRLARYLDSPDFEQQAMLLVVATHMRDKKQREETRSAVRAAVREGLRHSVGVGGERLLPLTDRVFDALSVACHQAPTEVAG